MSLGISTKVKSGKSGVAGLGLFAAEKIKKDEVVLDFSIGEQKIISSKEADELYKNGFDYMIQIADDRFLVTVQGPDQIERGYLNHSCNPNCGIQDTLKFVAMRDIAAGEELTIDYAIMESSDYSFECKCGNENCRKIITGNDWKIKELQEKYDGYFSDYLQQRIIL